MATISIPLSSFIKNSQNEPTVSLIGLRVNWHFSLRDGKGTIIVGKPHSKRIVTLETVEVEGVFKGSSGIIELVE